MRAGPTLWGLLLSLAASAEAALIRLAKDPPVPPIYPIGNKNETFAKPSGLLFEIDGKVQYFSGTNAWWLGHLSKNEDVDIAMKQIADTKYKIIRVWGFGDVTSIPDATTTDPYRVWYQLHNETGTYINYDQDGLQRLDYVVSTAERLGLKLVLPFVNNWPNLGGITVYDQTYGAEPDFLLNARSQEVYRDYIRVLVNRYKNSSAIFSWQLANEPRCTSLKGCNTLTLTKWANDTSRFIKSLDPHHMVSLGDEGWFGENDGYRDQDGTMSVAYVSNGGVDFLANLEIPTLDYGTFHLYTTTWGYELNWGNYWIQQHAEAGIKYKKPIVLEEYGTPINHTAALPWQDAVLHSTIAADQIWQFGPANLSEKFELDTSEGFIIFYDDPEYQLLATRQAQRMLDKKV